MHAAVAQTAIVALWRMIRTWPDLIRECRLSEEIVRNQNNSAMDPNARWRNDRFL